MYALTLAILLTFGTGQAPTEEATIQRQIEAWASAWNDGDARAVASFYTADAVRAFPHDVRVAGRDEIEEMYRQSFEVPVPEGIDRTLSVSVLSIRMIAPSVAVADYEFRATGLSIAPDLVVNGRSTLVLSKRNDVWLREIQQNWIPMTVDCARLCQDLTDS